MMTNLAPPLISATRTRVGVSEETMAVRAFSTSSLMKALGSPPFASKTFVVTSNS